MSTRYLIQPSTMTGIANAIRYRTGANGLLTTAEMIEKARESYMIDTDVKTCYFWDEQWTRPTEWPDLDSLNLTMSGDDFIYMTYDASNDASAIAWHIDTANSAAATLDIGHISNGTYVVDTTFSVAHNSNFVEWLDNYSGYIVVRITGQIARCYSYDVTRNGQIQVFRQQPVLERIAWVPHLINFVPTYNKNAWGMWSLEHEVIANGTGTSLTSLYYAYTECGRLRSLDISGLNTPNVTNFSYTFRDCFLLGPDLDLKHFNMAKVTNFSYMFYNCRMLRSIDMTGWNTGAATQMQYMFYGCEACQHMYGLASFNTANVTSFACMFQDCRSMKELPVSNFNTAKITNIGSMFYNCFSITELDLSRWTVSLVTNVGSAFYGCRSLKTLNIKNWSTGNLTTVASTFYYCTSLQEIDISGWHVTNTCTNIYGMFGYCFCLKEINIPTTWNVSGLGSGSNTANSMFRNCYSLEKLTGISNWNFQLSNNLTYFFAECWSLRELDVSGWNVSTITSFANMFQNCISLKTLNLSSWNPAASTSFASMFTGCNSLETIGDVSEWNVAKVTSTATMFSDCHAFKQIPSIASWNLAKCTSMQSMFQSCYSLRNITIQNLNIPLCTNVSLMFRYCYCLKNITLTGWTMPSQSTAPGQFLADCYNLTNVTININLNGNHSYANSRSLTYTSLLNIFNNLPTVSSKTLTLGSTNLNRLSSADKAIATAKGWTLAA